uniref:Reverse transcriptase domain-containing protein n=1 Tax=Tanacetum cinerariifolium TaxID=118510 RepID=A0A699H9F5_TANCI|nr:reverse transcriptase domain-containing protein [Tanacetum cinerariifolium]
MHIRSSSNLIVEPITISKRRNRRRSKQIVESKLRTIVETLVTTMADARTMSELLQAPTEGYGDVIVIPAILADNIKLKITSTLKYRNVSNEAIKLMFFLFSLDGAAQIWLEKEPPRSTLTWEDLVSKFVNHFFPPSKTTNLKNDITNFQQSFDEPFGEAWDRFKYLLRKCPHHGFSKLHQIDTFYNALTQFDQDSLNATAGGNLLNRTPRDALTIIKNKSKVRISRNNPIVSKVSTTTSSPSLFLDVTALTEIVKELVLMNKATQQATMKAIEETCVTCGGPHPYYECLATGGKTFDACAAVGTYNQGEQSELQPESIVRRLEIPLLRILLLLLLLPRLLLLKEEISFSEEIKTFLRTPDELSNLDDNYYDMDGDILYLDKLLNEDPSLNLPSMKNEDLKQVDVTMMKPSIEEPPQLELKDLPPHLEYAFL